MILTKNNIILATSYGFAHGFPDAKDCCTGCLVGVINDAVLNHGMHGPNYIGLITEKTQKFRVLINEVEISRTSD